VVPKEQSLGNSFEIYRKVHYHYIFFIPYIERHLSASVNQQSWQHTPKTGPLLNFFKLFFGPRFEWRGMEIHWFVG